MYLRILRHDSSHPSDENQSLGTPESRAPSLRPLRHDRDHPVEQKSLDGGPGRSRPFTRPFMRPVLAFGHEVEEIEELRKADGGGFRALNQGFAFGPERGHAEGHGDAVVVA
jgi:hypothetical protein